MVLVAVKIPSSVLRQLKAWMAAVFAEASELVEGLGHGNSSLGSFNCRCVL